LRGQKNVVVNKWFSSSFKFSEKKGFFLNFFRGGDFPPMCAHTLALQTCLLGDPPWHVHVPVFINVFVDGLAIYQTIQQALLQIELLPQLKLMRAKITNHNIILPPLMKIKIFGLL
jgi:hypothetical protein